MNFLGRKLPGRQVFHFGLTYNRSLQVTDWEHSYKRKEEKHSICFEEQSWGMGYSRGQEGLSWEMLGSVLTPRLLYSSTCLRSFQIPGVWRLSNVHWKWSYCKGLEWFCPMQGPRPLGNSGAEYSGHVYINVLIELHWLTEHKPKLWNLLLFLLSTRALHSECNIPKTVDKYKT